MRISTSYYYQVNAQAMQNEQTNLNTIQQQVATGLQYQTPADNPVAATEALRISQALAASQNNSSNIKAAQFDVNQESTILSAINTDLSSAQNLAVGTQSSSSTQDRTSSASALQQLYNDLLSYANSTDANGNYIFAGSKGSTVPFQQTTGVSNYQGDNLQQSIAISANRNIPITDSGQSVFSVGTANDVFGVISQLIKDMQGPLTGAAFSSQINIDTTNLNNAIANVQNVSSQVANRLQELNAAATTETNLQTQYQNQLDTIQNVDTAKAATQLQLQETQLTASYQAFSSASKLSLFNYI